MNTPQIIEYNNQRLLTTEQLAEFYHVGVKQIQQNFGNNRDKFIEGKHYFYLKGQQLKEFKMQLENIELVNPRVSHLLLYTKQGASRHSKMLGTDRAWDMYDQLEENYFNPPQQMALPTSPRELIQLALEGNVEVNQRVDEIDGRLKEIEENKLITTEDKGTLDRMVRKKVYLICKEQHLDQEAKSLLFSDIGSSIKQVFEVPNRGRIKDKDFEKVIDFINMWEPSSVTKAKIRQMSLYLAE